MPTRQKPVKPNKKSAAKLRDAHKKCQARILLRKVDDTLKKKGVNAALKALMQVRLKTPINPAINSWLNDYRDMLDAWKYKLMPDVVGQFTKYGFRRAKALVCEHIAYNEDEHKGYFYAACERTLTEMAQRSCSVISDLEGTSLDAEPAEVSIDDVDDGQVERGSKF